jgi:CO dehydrogenase/acetyl-CoA synthase gamma subunit (corrinoid Fe-S protein)
MYNMSQELTCTECGLDMVGDQCQCFANALLDLTTKLDDLMKLVARSDIIKKLDA